jgi:hypothetical protein
MDVLPDPFLSLRSEANANPAAALLLVRQEGQGDRKIAPRLVKEQRRRGDCDLHDKRPASAWTDDEESQVHGEGTVFEDSVEP